MSLLEIQAFLAGRRRLSAEILARLAGDPRSGVRRAFQQWRKQRESALAERRRMRRILDRERQLWADGILHVAGVDEAGVGPLAGPVVAAAVIFPPQTEIPEIDDSKRLDPEIRLQLEGRIRRRAAAIGLGIAEVGEIDSLNIYHAALQAMRRAVLALQPAPQHLLVDAREIPDIPLPQEPIPGGDRRHFSIAAASILAKTHRDRLMEELDRRFPQYGFARHKGYCTPEHQEAIRRHGVCAAHRQSYTFVRELAGECSTAYQQLKDRLEREDSAQELAAIRRELRWRTDFDPGERRKLQQLLSRRQKKYPKPRQLSLL